MSAAKKPNGKKSAAKAEKKTRKVDGRSRRERWVFRGMLAVVVLVILRVTLGLVFLPVINLVLSSFELEATYDRASLSVLSGELEIWNLVVSDQAAEDGADPVISIDHIRGDVGVLRVLTGDLFVSVVEVDGVDLNVERAPDGSIPLLERFRSDKPPEPAEGPLEFSLPVSVEFLRVQHVYANWTDRSVDPPLKTRVDVHMRASDLGDAERHARLEVLVSSREFLDSMRLEGSVFAEGRDLDGKFDVSVRGLRPKPLEPYLAAFGLRSLDEQISVDSSLVVEGRPVPEDEEAVEIDLSIRETGVHSDTREVVGVRSVTVHVDRLSREELSVATVSIDGVDVRVRRGDGGHVEFAGIEWAPDEVESPAVVDASTATKKPAKSVDVSTGSGDEAEAPQAMSLALGRVELTNVRLDWRDNFASPDGRVELRLDRLLAQCGDEKASEGTGLPWRISANGTAPGLFEAAELDAQLESARISRKGQIALGVRGISPVALAPYLEPFGIETTLERAEVTVRGTVDLETPGGGRFTASLDLDGFELSDGDAIASLGGLKVDSLRFDPRQREVPIRSIEVRGADSSLRIAEDGVIHAMGFSFSPGRVRAAKSNSVKTGTPEAIVSSSAGSTSASQPAEDNAQEGEPVSSGAGLPILLVESFAVRDNRFRFLDERLASTVAIDVSDFGVEVLGLRLLPDLAEDSKKATYHAWVEIGGVVSKAAVRGNLSLSGEGLHVDGKVEAREMSGETIAPYLRPLGVDPVLESGALDLAFEVGVDLSGAVATLAARVHDVQFRDEDSAWASLEELGVEGIRHERGRTKVSSVKLRAPRAEIFRDGDGALLIGGLKFASPPPSGQEADEKAKGSSLPPKTDEPPVDFAALWAGLPGIDIDEVAVEGATLTWNDGAVEPPVALAPVVDVTLRGFSNDSNAKPAEVMAKLSIPGVIDSASLRGTLLAARRQELQADVQVLGLRSAALEGYFPAGLSSDLEDGRFACRVLAGLEIAPRGARDLELAVEAIDFRDGEERPLLSMDSVRIAAPSIHIDEAVHIAEIVADGLETRAARHADGLALLGHRFASVASEVASESSGPSGRDTAGNVAGEREGSEAITDGRPPKFPSVLIDKFLVGVRRVEVVDRSVDEGEPLLLTNWTVTNPDPIRLVPDLAAKHETVALDIEGSAAPLLDNARIDLRLQPLVESPEVAATVNLRGIDGTRLSRVIPSLASAINGCDVTDGTLSLSAKVTLEAKRRHALDFSMLGGFGVDLEVEEIRYLDKPGGEELAGLKSLRVEVERIDPAAGLVHVGEIEVDTPSARLLRDEKGLHALGIVWNIPNPALEADDQKPDPTEETGEKKTDDEQADDSGPTSSIAVDSIARPVPVSARVESAVTSDGSAGAASSEVEGGSNGPIVKLDQLVASGLDLVFEDRTGSRPTIVPLKGMDVELSRVRIGGRESSEPLGFYVSLQSGEIDLPERQTTGFLAGAIGGAVDVVSGQDSAPVRFERRKAFEEIALSGRVVLSGKPTGWVKSSVSGLELANFKGILEPFKIELTDGLLDAGLTARLRNDRTLAVGTQTTVTHLQLSEPEGGPIERYLKLPAPLEAAIFAIRDADGAVLLPVSVRLPLEDLDLTSLGLVTQVGGAVLGTIRTVLVNAILAAPERALSAGLEVVGLESPLGLLGGADGENAGRKFLVEFSPGDAALPKGIPESLAELIEILDGDDSLVVVIRHQLGDEDMLRAKKLANPSPDDCRQLIDQLDQKKRRLQRQVDFARGRVRAEYAAGFAGRAEAERAKLEALYVELGSTEDAIDRIYELLRPGQERQVRRRTRGASIALGESRAESIRRILLDSGVDEIAQRIKTLPTKFQPSGRPEGGAIELETRIRQEP